MAVLKFRVFFEEEDAIYRDVVIKHTQTFKELHHIILQSFGFDDKHQATFYRSNKDWARGREISLEKYDKAYKATPLLMSETKIATEILVPDQRFIYEYDFVKGWVFCIVLIAISKQEDKNMTYPFIARKEGVGPSQYEANNILGTRLIAVEEKYDLQRDAEGFGSEGEDCQEDSLEE